VFILEHYTHRSRLLLFVKYLVCVCVCPDKEVPNTTIVHRLVTKFRTQEVFVCQAVDVWLSSDKTAENTVVPISSIASAARI
jgi:hypothetical protein